MLAVTLSLGLALLPFVSAAVHNVQVGGAGGKLEYVPEAISAQPGDQVIFHFNPKNHTVSQSSFANPCGLKEGGFDSGFFPVMANQTDQLPTYTIIIHDTEPVWVYCRQAGKTPASHCGQGMVFAVNCGLDDAPNSFSNFKKSALAIGASLAAEAAASSPAPADPYGATPTTVDPYAAPPNASPTAWETAAYGGYSIPAAPIISVVTETVTVERAVWTTTYSSYPGSPAPTPVTLEGQVHKVVVGGSSGLIFDPPFIAAQPRDTVLFEFHQKNHTVTQSSFADPCRKLSANGVVGFDSDFVPVAEGATEFPTWSITVNDTAPIWAYCRQKIPVSHCGQGMVFAINPVETSARNFAAFQDVAKAINGTAAAANDAAAPTTTPVNGAISVRIGGAGVTLVAAAFLAAFL